MDKELAQLQWSTDERLLAIHNDDHSRYWNDENLDEFEDSLFNIV
jgi:hypothetical protein